MAMDNLLIISEAELDNEFVDYAINLFELNCGNIMVGKISDICKRKERYSIFDFAILLLYNKAKNISTIVKFAMKENITIFPMSKNFYQVMVNWSTGWLENLLVVKCKYKH